jgi:hypothetical protein
MARYLAQVCFCRNYRNTSDGARRAAVFQQISAEQSALRALKDFTK